MPEKTWCYCTFQHSPYFIDDSGDYIYFVIMPIAGALLTDALQNRYC